MVSKVQCFEEFEHSWIWNDMDYLKKKAPKQNQTKPICPQDEILNNRDLDE